MVDSSPVGCRGNKPHVPQPGHLHNTKVILEPPLLCRLPHVPRVWKQTLKMENQGQGSLQNLPGRSTGVDISVTGPSTPLWHTPVLYPCIASRFGGTWAFELAKQGQEESPAEALWWARKGFIRWKVALWKWAKLFLVFHLSFSSECGWQLHCPFASHRLHSVATQHTQLLRTQPKLGTRL